MLNIAALAQLVEHPPCKRKVSGSNPESGSILKILLISKNIVLLIDSFRNVLQQPHPISQSLLIFVGAVVIIKYT